MPELKDLLLIFFIFGGGFWVLRPLAHALAKRIGAGARPPIDSHALEEMRDEMRQLREEVTQLAERVDFAERALAQQKTGQRIGPA